MISPARALAYEVVHATFERDAHTEVIFRAAAERAGLAGRERAQAQHLAYGTVQRRGTLDAGLAQLADRPLHRLDPPLRTALRLGLFELLFAAATPDHAAVDQAVELVKRGGAGHAAGFANAVLRRAARERDSLLATLLGDDSTPEKAAMAHSVPLWLAQMWWRELGPDDARSLLAACNEPPEVAFRVNTLITDRDTVLTKLRAARIEARPGASVLHSPSISRRMQDGSRSAPETIIVTGQTGETVPELVAAGELTPQSRGSASVVELLDPQPGEQVLDLCAGPGIKTGQIAARMGDRGEVISVESDPARAVEVAAQADRLGLRSLTVIETDATNSGMAPGFDRVLLDPPCSDLGTLASRPDARWRKSPAAIERLVELQAKLLRRAGEALRPGGILVYSTCTISARENAELVAQEAGDLRIERQVQLRPDRDRTSGFFICRLKRDDGGDE